MGPQRPDSTRILFLFSDTGGGHRSACEAITEALQAEFGSLISTEMVDIFKEYAPRPFELAPRLYPRMARMPDIWRLGYLISDGKRRRIAFDEILSPYVETAVQRMIADHPADLVVSVHPLANELILRGLGRKRPPFVTVVTDMVSTHAFWFSRKADLILVPTEEARQRGIELGARPERILVAGLPVALRFTAPLADKQDLRRKLGWPENLPTVLLVGGGEGMGPLEKVAYAIDSSNLPISLVIIAGRNRGLKTRLETYPWRIHARTYGFVRQMPEFMRAADVLVTKAGPGTISEAFIAGLPLVLYSRMPGQEDGNVSYVVTEGAGVWAPRPEQVVDTLVNWLEHPDQQARAADASLRLARPEAARTIARALALQLGITLPIAVHS
jgi:1,2-diacylglycerol 3-beta-galactosyltransferase